MGRENAAGAHLYKSRHEAETKCRALPYSVAEKEASRGRVTNAGIGELGNRAGVIFEKGNSCGRGTEGRGRKLQKRVQSKPPLTEDDAEIWIESSAVAFQYQSIISPWRRQHSAQNRGQRASLAGKRPAGHKPGQREAPGLPRPVLPQTPPRRHGKAAPRRPMPQRSSPQGSVA